MEWTESGFCDGVCADNRCCVDEIGGHCYGSGLWNDEKNSAGLACLFSEIRKMDKTNKASRLVQQL